MHTFFVLIIFFLEFILFCLFKKASALIFLLSNKTESTSEKCLSKPKHICNAESRQDQENCFSNFTASVDGCNESWKIALPSGYKAMMPDYFFFLTMSAYITEFTVLFSAARLLVKIECLKGPAELSSFGYSSHWKTFFTDDFSKLVSKISMHLPFWVYETK